MSRGSRYASTPRIPGGSHRPARTTALRRLRPAARRLPGPAAPQAGDRHGIADARPPRPAGRRRAITDPGVRAWRRSGTGTGCGCTWMRTAAPASTGPAPTRWCRLRIACWPRERLNQPCSPGLPNACRQAAWPTGSAAWSCSPSPADGTTVLRSADKPDRPRTHRAAIAVAAPCRDQAAIGRAGRPRRRLTAGVPPPGAAGRTAACFASGLHHGWPAMTLTWDHRCFFQVNPAQNERLVGLALGLLTPRDQQFPVLDLFCGMGNFSVPLGLVGCPGDRRRTARTSHPLCRGPTAGQAACSRPACSPVTSATQPAAGSPAEGTAVCGHRSSTRRVRAPGQATALLRVLGPEQIVSLSCDPATLTRDLGELVATGAGIWREWCRWTCSRRPTTSNPWPFLERN